MLLQRKRRRPRNLRLLHLVPNLFTILGLCAGLTGIRYALDGRWELAVTFIVVAGVFDGLDGRSARLLKLTSKLGAELDSLADFLSFGVAPAVIVYLWTLRDVQGFGWALAMLFATCCALRLARFNSELEQPDRPRWMLYFFTGIPAPAAAGLALVPMMMSFAQAPDLVRDWWLNAALMLFVACMMVSRVPTFSIKRLRVRRDLVLPTLLGCGLVIALAVAQPWLVLSLVGLAYLGALPFGVMAARRMRLEEEARAAGAEPAAAESKGPEAPPQAEPGRIVSLEPRQAKQP
jgi:CDP-diacylglycerol--serine O-phosphatidyltransferase